MHWAQGLTHTQIRRARSLATGRDLPPAPPFPQPPQSSRGRGVEVDMGMHASAHSSSITFQSHPPEIWGGG